MSGLEHDGEALASRRGNAFGRAFVLDRLVSARALRTEVIHGDGGVDGCKCLASGVEG